MATMVLHCASGFNGYEVARLLENNKATLRVYADDGHGSAVVLSADGHLLTCAHAVFTSKGERPLKITIDEGQGKIVTYPTRLIKYDFEHDLAVVKIERRFDYYAVLGDIATVREADRVYNIGYPYQFGKLVAVGHVAAVRYSNANLGLKNVLVVNIENGKGTSGSGVFSAKNGKLLGIISRMHWASRAGEPPRVIRILVQVDDIRKFLESAPRISYATEFPIKKGVSTPVSTNIGSEYKIQIGPIQPSPTK